MGLWLCVPPMGNECPCPHLVAQGQAHGFSPATLVTLPSHSSLRCGRAELRGAGEEERGKCCARAQGRGQHGHSGCCRYPSSPHCPLPHPHASHVPLYLQELFIANSQRYVQETELSQHVRLWEEKMGPALQEQVRCWGSSSGAGGMQRVTTDPSVPQEERTAFDIHSYGDRLAARFGSLGEWQSFASLVAGQPPFEVCRYMLASLQLVSVGALGAGGAPGEGVFLLQPPDPAPLPRPTTTPWRWRRTQGWRRRWTRYGCGC